MKKEIINSKSSYMDRVADSNSYWNRPDWTMTIINIKQGLEKRYIYLKVKG